MALGLPIRVQITAALLICIGLAVSISMKEICFLSEPVRPDVASGGHPGKGLGVLHPRDPQARHHSRAGQSSDLKSQEESAQIATKMQHCYCSWEMKSPHREVSLHLVKTFHSDCNQSITFCLTFSLAVMGSLGISQQEISKGNVFQNKPLQ